MWRSKKGFNEFVEIVKQMPFLSTDKIYRPYRRWCYNSRTYIREEPETLNVESLMKFINTLEDLYAVEYADVRNDGVTLEEFKIQRLVNWCRLRNYNSTKEFRETRRKYDYFKRLEDYENN